jgi:hypothetical protein
MIRDPSDGTVREVPSAVGITTTKPAIGIPIAPDTGIRQPTRNDAMQRLDKSREWLRDYHAAKEAANARGSNGEELQAAGHSVEDVREAKPAPRSTFD